MGVFVPCRGGEAEDGQGRDLYLGDKQPGWRDDLVFIYIYIFTPTYLPAPPVRMTDNKTSCILQQHKVNEFGAYTYPPTRRFLSTPPTTAKQQGSKWYSARYLSQNLLNLLIYGS